MRLFYLEMNTVGMAFSMFGAFGDRKDIATGQGA